MSDQRGEASQPSAPAPDLASEILEGLALNMKANGIASAEATAVTLIGSALRFILLARGPEAARRMVEQVRDGLDDAIILNSHQDGAVH